MNTPNDEKNVELTLHEEPQHKPTTVVTLDELRRRQLREAKKEALIWRRGSPRVERLKQNRRET